MGFNSGFKGLTNPLFQVTEKESQWFLFTREDNDGQSQTTDQSA